MSILGLDVGGANLKAATVDGRTAQVPFALWKHPHDLPAALAELVARFPDTTRLAATMTGELCDCYPTKRDGVSHILASLVSIGLPTHVWGTVGRFLTVEAARDEYLTVAAANWHALATYCGRFHTTGRALLLDIGTTTTDVIPLVGGAPAAVSRTDVARMRTGELVYTGVRRTPVCALLSSETAAELFATTADVYVLLGDSPEDPTDTDTADGRPLTVPNCHARMARMLGGDAETVPFEGVVNLARRTADRQAERIRAAIDRVGPVEHVFISGSGEFLARRLVTQMNHAGRLFSLSDALGPDRSTVAPAYAVAVLAAERSA